MKNQKAIYIMKRNPVWIISIFLLIGLLDLAVMILAADDPWVRKADMPTPREYLSTSVVDGIIYAIGGYSGNYNWFFSEVEAYDPATDTWTRKADMPSERADLSVSVVNGIIYAVGGLYREHWRALSNVEAYDPARDIWMEQPDMPIPREALSTSLVNGSIYVIGGYERPYGNGTGSGYITSTVEESNWLLDVEYQHQAVDAKEKLITVWGNIKNGR